VTPNAISMTSVLFGAGAGIALLLSGRTAEGGRIALLAAAALCIQLRLLCNLLDGLVAIEGGRATKAGELFNEVPDRVSDVVILVAAGYAVTGFDWGPLLGWTAALTAVLTAYVRALGNALGVPGLFEGPMAKPQRMAAITAACALEIVDVALGAPMPRAMLITLIAVAGGSVLTIARRLARIAAALEAR
jgi:phosphatidylglycerophosphate synthase